jgi:hypothetical protein
MRMRSNNWEKTSGELDAIGIWTLRSPSPRPSPQGRGRMVDSVLANLVRQVCSRDGVRGSLSLGERAGVRGNGPSGLPAGQASE